jgi:sec-independent protein translocase protein TatB
VLQGGELIIILIVALIVLGPTRLPDLARKAGEYATELRKAAREIQRGLEAEVSDLKAASDEIRAVKDEFRKPIDDVRQGVDEVGVSRLDWTGPKPLSGPTPADAMADLEEIERRAKSPESHPPPDAEEE